VISSSKSVDFQINLNTYRKDTNKNFILVLPLPNIPVCKTLSSLKNIPVFEIFINEIKKYASEFLDLCSRTGEFKAMNISLETSAWAKLFPKGEYMNNYHLFDANDNNVANLTFYTSITH
jgi:hypothetical protein